MPPLKYGRCEVCSAPLVYDSTEPRRCAYCRRWGKDDLSGFNDENASDQIMAYFDDEDARDPTYPSPVRDDDDSEDHRDQFIEDRQDEEQETGFKIMTQPQGIKGPWKAGFVLDWHSIESTCVGQNEFGHPIWDTKRTEVGELLYRFKYKHDQSALEPLVQIAAKHLESAKGRIDVIVPIPPSNPSRRVTADIAEGIGKLLGVPVSLKALQKIKATPNIKNMADFEKEKVLAGALSADMSQLSGKTILLVDDLYDSGATMTAATKAAYDQGKAKIVYAFAVTRTR